MNGPLRLLWILLLALACGPALALGLGQIEVRSRPGEPLLAEIPIVSSDPSELEQLQARLASPDTFARVGLEPPSGLVQDLQFAVGLDAQGRPVIRVTTDAPVQQPLLTFLVEVDWGQGRLVREYSALVDTPETVAAIAQPPIQAPTPAPSNTIAREPDVVAPSPVVAPLPEEETAAALAVESREVAPQPVAPAPAPVAIAAAPAPVAMAAGQTLAPVRAGQTLSGIAHSLAAETGRSLDQTMIALLRANPEAFIRGNINLLREGAVLRVPGASDWDGVDAREASALVREHVAQWRGMRQPVPQPVEAAGATAATAQAARRVDARLEIVPPTGDTNQAGTRSGIAAGGGGDMLQQELVQTRETLAARDAEIEELKARVADLEQLQRQQQQLIEMKDSELASAQQRLAQSNAQSVQEPAPATASATDLPWAWIGLGALALALLGWWLGSRRSAKPAFLSGGAEPAAPPAPSVPKSTPSPATPSGAATAMAASGWPSATPKAPEPAQDPVAPTWHATGDGASKAATIAPLNPAPAGQERVELARAYLDLGDVDTARTLLQEVVDAGDPASRDAAERLLRELA